MLEKYICLYRWNIFGYEIPVKGVLFISYFDELDLIYDEIKPILVDFSRIILYFPEIKDAGTNCFGLSVCIYEIDKVDISK